jgi:hypothetical protein
MSGSEPAKNPAEDGLPAMPAASFTPELQMANMLGLCEAQMESALQESDRAVDALIQAFTCLVDTTRSVNALTDSLPAELKETVAGGLNQQVEAITKQMASAVVAFQFYDKLTQRLGHVRYSLSTLALFVCDRSQSASPDQWRRLLNTLRRLYRTEEEREIFQSIMDGIASEQAGIPDGSADKNLAQAPKTGEVELF